MDIDARAFGQLEGEVKALHAMLAQQNDALAALSLQLDEVRKTLDEARGGWKTLLWLGGAAAAASSAATYLLQHTVFAK